MPNNEQLEQLKSETQLLISKISHEIRNPVALIQSTLDLMAVRHPEITQFDEWDDVMDSMDYLKGLLNDVSEFNNAARLHLQPTHMKEFLTATLRSLQPTLDYLFIRLVPELTLPEAPLLIDPTKFRQALLNLLRNAYEASPMHGIIHFYAFSKNSLLILQIEDNGCGIPPEDLSTLFQPFVTHKKEGTGLGLTITKQIIEAHNGTITVESSLGRGTKFTITLPMTS